MAEIQRVPRSIPNGDGVVPEEADQAKVLLSHLRCESILRSSKPPIGGPEMSAAGNGKIPELLATEAVTVVLKTQWDGEPAVRLDSPPGAGKTWVVERLAVQAMELHREQCMISTQTNEQAF